MIKFITTILIGCSLTLAAGVRAEQENPKKKPAQKSKPVQQQQAVLQSIPRGCGEAHQLRDPPFVQVCF